MENDKAKVDDTRSDDEDDGSDRDGTSDKKD